MGRGESQGCLIPTKSVIVALILGGGLFGVLLFLVNFTRPSRAPVGAVTAALTVIPSFSSTATPTIEENSFPGIPADFYKVVDGPGNHDNGCERPVIEPGFRAGKKSRYGNDKSSYSVEPVSSPLDIVRNPGIRMLRSAKPRTGWP